MEGRASPGCGRCCQRMNFLPLFRRDNLCPPSTSSPLRVPAHCSFLLIVRVNYHFVGDSIFPFLVFARSLHNAPSPSCAQTPTFQRIEHTCPASAPVRFPQPKDRVCLFRSSRRYLYPATPGKYSSTCAISARSERANDDQQIMLIRLVPNGSFSPRRLRAASDVGNGSLVSTARKRSQIHIWEATG